MYSTISIPNYVKVTNKLGYFKYLLYDKESQSI